ncbi:MAG: PilN domain-containing protein [Sandaracinaceae bacterium]|nr:PilN domain-containing protein [Sandaracinaceae bacterium]
MIRINLLPKTKKQAQAQSSGGGPLWAGIYLLAAFVWGIGLALLFFQKQGELEGIQRNNRQLDVEIADLQQRTSRLEELQAQLARSRGLEEVVAELNRARTGPLRVMMELSQVLSVPGGPTIDAEALERQRQINPYAGFREGWDVRRLWLTQFSEENRECRIHGEARTNEDVAEFLRRLSLSELFTEVVLTRTQGAESRSDDVIRFELNCRVRY